MACLLEGVRRVRGGIGGLERLHGGRGAGRVEGVKEEHGGKYLAFKSQISKLNTFRIVMIDMP